MHNMKWICVMFFFINCSCCRQLWAELWAELRMTELLVVTEDTFAQTSFGPCCLPGISVTAMVQIWKKVLRGHQHLSLQCGRCVMQEHHTGSLSACSFSTCSCFALSCSCCSFSLLCFICFIFVARSACACLLVVTDYVTHTTDWRCMCTPSCSCGSMCMLQVKC